MHKTELPMFFACPSRLTTMRLLRGGPVMNFRSPCVTTPDKSGRITPHLSGLYSGTYYSATSSLSSSTAPLPKRALIASRGLSKTSVAPSAATCERTIEEASLYVFYQYPALMDHLTTIPNFWEK